MLKDTGRLDLARRLRTASSRWSKQAHPHPGLACEIRMLATGDVTEHVENTGELEVLLSTCSSQVRDCVRFVIYDTDMMPAQQSMVETRLAALGRRWQQLAELTVRSCSWRHWSSCWSTGFLSTRPSWSTSCSWRPRSRSLDMQILRHVPTRPCV